MCSVVGYCGAHSAVDRVLDGLARLEYRGYDSAGCAFIQGGRVAPTIIKTVGGVTQLKHSIRQYPGLALGALPTICMGHTRWSTHGVVSEANAHPHTDCTGAVAVVHNGIIENHHELKADLSARGHHIATQADTELVAHVWEEVAQQQGDALQAAVASVAFLQGAYALIVMHEKWPQTLIAVRKSSPLCIGLSGMGTYIASDTLAFAGQAREVIYLPDESFALITAQGCLVYDFAGNELIAPVQQIAHMWVDEGKGSHPHYTHKEIFQQPRVIADTLSFMRRTQGRLGEQLGLTQESLLECQRIQLIACGSSYHAGAVAELFFQEIAGIPTQAVIASEFRHRTLFAHEHSLHIGISQSGETADTLEALRMIRAMKLHTLALVNVASSTMVREADGFILTQAGYEIAVASTKAFTAQVASLYWFAHWLAVQRGTLPASALIRAEQELASVAQVLDESMQRYEPFLAQSIAGRYARYQGAMFLGRHVTYPFSLEAALKLKEVAYCFAQGYPAGELKHGPLALVDAQMPVFLFSSMDDSVYRKLCGNAQEVKARGGRLLVWAFEHQHELIALADEVFIFPRVARLLVPLAMAGVMQLFVYHVACALDRPIDRPRNLAKSVTVE